MQLTFIYNAQSGKWKSLLDSLHKSLFPQSYVCDLCRLTHGFWGERESWSEFREEFDGEIAVFHKDEIPEELQSLSGELPVILINRPEDREFFLNRREISRCHTAADLIDAIHRRLKHPASKL